MSLVTELKRRNVFRVATAYVVASWILLDVSALLLEVFGAPPSIMQVIVALIVLGFIFSISFTWAVEGTPDGIRRETEVERDPAASQRAAKRLDILTITLVAVAVVIFTVDKLTQTSRGTRGGREIVVPDS